MARGDTWSVIACADWSKERKKREVYAASPRDKRVWRMGPPRGGWDFESVVAAAETAGAEETGPALVGFDAPIGVPAGFIDPTRARSFTAWLRSPRGTEAFVPVRSPGEWTVSRPFFIVPGGEGSIKAFYARMEEALVVQPLRWIERKTQGKCVFIAGGIPGSVGSSAIDLWSGLRKCPSRVAIWPFDGGIEELRRGSKTVVGEIYPRMAYGLAIGLGKGRQVRVAVAKTNREVREAFLQELMGGENWVRRRKVTICDFERAAESEDAFDALVTAAALLRCVLEGTPLSNTPLDDRVAEGGILGGGSVYLNRREQAFRPGDAGGGVGTVSRTRKRRSRRTYPRYSCPIGRCHKEFRGSRSGWDAHVQSVAQHRAWHPTVKSRRNACGCSDTSSPSSFAERRVGRDVTERLEVRVSAGPGWKSTSRCGSGSTGAAGPARAFSGGGSVVLEEAVATARYHRGATRMPARRPMSWSPWTREYQWPCYASVR